MMLHVFNQFLSDISYYIGYYKYKINQKLIIKQKDYPKISKYLLYKKWLWIKIDGMEYINNFKRANCYKHFIFRGCIACDNYWLSKDEILNNWYKIWIEQNEPKKGKCRTYTKQELRDIKINSILNG